MPAASFRPRLEPTPRNPATDQEVAMFTHPELFLLLAHDTASALRAEADRQRLLTAARRARQARRGHRRRAAASAPASTLAPCAPTAAPAR
jgi:hypothetical protein